MDNIETFLQQHAFFGGDTLPEVVDLKQIMDLDSLEQIGEGMNARVFRIPNSDWVIKEGRWDLDVSFVKDLKIKFPRQTTHDFLKNFGLTFNPTSEEIISQYQNYLTFATYFGYFDSDSKYYHPDKDQIFTKQQIIRQKLKSAIEELESTYWLSFPETIQQLFYPTFTQHNFVPDEYTLSIKSFSPENQGKDTYAIFQKYYTGNLFHDVSLKDLEHEEVLQVILFAYISLYLRIEENLAIDLRPRHILTESLDWFGNTDNFMITKEGVKMIDTRWLWNLDGSIIQRGGIIPEQILLSTRNFIQTALKKYA